MIGIRFTPHRAHGVAVLVRVVAAMAFVVAAATAATSLIGVTLHHLSAEAALVRTVAALACTVAALFAARRFDPLRD